MPRLPTVLMTVTIRGSKPGESHGGAHLIDLENSTSRPVIDWNPQDISWDGRGAERGLRGAVVRSDEVLIATHNRVLVFDRDFRPLRDYSNRYLGDIHELSLSGSTLHIASTRFDSLLSLDLDSGEFTSGLLFRIPWAVNPRTTGMPAGPAPPPRIMVYNPMRDKGPNAKDTVHLNQVWAEDGRLYFAGVLLRHVLYLENGGVRKHAEVPEWTHNARPFKGGVLCNATKQDAVLHVDAKGAPIKQFAVPRYDEGALLNIPESAKAARQGFARGLIATDDGLIIAASSPGTVSVFDYESGAMIRSVNVTMDVRHAPHGLCLWPF